MSFRAGILLLAFLPLGCGRKPLHEGRDVAELEGLLQDPNPTVQAQAAKVDQK